MLTVESKAMAPTTPATLSHPEAATRVRDRILAIADRAEDDSDSAFLRELAYACATHFGTTTLLDLAKEA